MFLLPLHRLNRPKIPRGRGLGQIHNTRAEQGDGTDPTIQIEQAGDTEGGGGQTDMFLILLHRPNELKIPGFGWVGVVKE